MFACILILSMGLQVAAAILSLRLIKLTHRKIAWSLIAIGFIVMSSRRVLSLYAYLCGQFRPLDYPMDLLGLLISIVMLAGVILIGPIFRSMNEAYKLLEEREVKYRTLHDAAFDALLTVCYPLGRILEANNAAAILLGHLKSRLLEMACQDITAPEAWPELEAKVQEYLTRNSAFVIDTCWVNADKVRIPVSVSGRLCELEGIKAVQLVGRDVTEQRRSADALRESEERLRLLLESADDIILMFDLDGNILYFNGASRFHIGPYQGPSTDLLPEVFRGRAQDLMKQAKQVAETGQGYTEENELFWGGERLFFQGTLFPIRDASGRVARVGRICRNVTKLKRLEELYSLALANSKVGVWEWDIATDVFQMSDNFLSLLGYEQNEIGGTLEGWFSHMHPSDADTVRKAVREHVEGRTPDFSVTHRFLHKEGSVCWMLSVGRTERGASGKPVRMVGTCTDITGQKNAEEVMRSASLFEATATLAGGIAHRFNNLMAVVLGNACLLRDDLESHPASQHSLREIEEAAINAGDLARQMLAFARRGKYHPAELNLNALIKQTLQLHESKIPSRIQIIEDLEKGLWHIKADATQVELVILNVMMNAIESIEAEGSITIRTYHFMFAHTPNHDLIDIQEGPYVIMTISDTGCGMPAETIRHIYEPFYSTKAPGRGLGLAAVFGIMKNHDGHVDIHSEPGAGSRATLYFPAINQLPVEQNGHETAALPHGSETILIVDDQAMILAATRMLFERLGYSVLTAKHGREAIETAWRKGPDIQLVILDMIMPEMGGCEAFPHLRKACPSAKILLLSGYEFDESAQSLLDQGAIEFIQKPVPGAVLARTVRRVLDTVQ